MNSFYTAGKKSFKAVVAITDDSFGFVLLTVFFHNLNLLFFGKFTEQTFSSLFIMNRRKLRISFNLRSV